MAKIDLFSSEWCDEIFDGKNKSYGAYPLREKSAQRHNVALIFIVSVTTLIFLLPTLFFAILDMRPKKLTLTSVTAISRLGKPDDPLKKMKNLDFNVHVPPVEKTSTKVIKFTAPLIKDDDQLSMEDEAASGKVLAKANAKVTVPEDEQKEDTSYYLPPQEIPVQAKADDKMVYMVVDSMPEFPGGETAMMQYLATKIKYPFWAQRYNMQGEVLIQFIVNADGSLSDCRIIKGAGVYLDMEALKAVRQMPKWRPGKKKGKPIRSRCVIPVTFRLQ
jgi:protein TonB